MLSSTSCFRQLHAFRLVVIPFTEHERDTTAWNVQSDDGRLHGPQEGDAAESALGQAVEQSGDWLSWASRFL